MEERNVLSCTLIYGGTAEEQQKIKEILLEKYPEDRVAINPAFSLTITSGLFHREKENKKSVLGILMDDPIIQKLGQDYVVSQLRELDAEFFMYRSMRALSLKQRERASLLYEVLRGRNRILLCDSDLQEKNHYFAIARWLNQSREFRKNQGQLAWITDLPIFDFLQYPKKLYGTTGPVYSLLPEFLPVMKIENGSLTKEIDSAEESEVIVRWLSERNREILLAQCNNDPEEMERMLQELTEDLKNNFEN